jgi:predicted acylesterase/phospholipase RssA
MLASRGVRGAFAVALLVCALPIAAAPRRGRIPLTIGLVIFNKSPESKKADPLNKTNEEIVTEYLDRVSDQSKKEAGRHVRFDVVRGNYYQVLHWMRTGAIDGAVLSAFSYELLQEDAERLRTPPDRRSQGVVTFPIPGRRSGDDGNEPVFSAYTNGKVENDADAVLERCLKPETNCTFQFISHLSTTGFFYPAFRLTFVGPTRLTVDQMMKRAQFVLWHGADDPLPVGTVLRFSYASKSKDAAWHPLLPNQTTFASDVLAINCGTTHLHGRCKEVVSLLQRDAASAVPPLDATHKTDRYTGPVIFKQEPFDLFAGQAQKLRDSSFRQNNRWDDWYVRENYEFSTGEIVDLLRNDQFVDHRRQASLVLPGGGVRGAYQAAMLDHLYGSNLLNILPGAKEPASTKPGGRFEISSIIGTSGGALVGYLAAHRGTAKDLSLTDHWISKGKVRITPSQIFPWLSPLRFLSLLIALTIFGTFAAMTTPANAKRCETCGGHRSAHSCQDCGASQGAPVELTVAFGLILLAAPALIWRLSLLNEHFQPFDAGYMYAALIVALHAIHSTIEEGTSRPRKRTIMISAAVIGIIGSILLAAEAMNLFARENDGTGVGSPYVALISIVLATAMSLLLAVAGGAVFNRRRAMGYLKAWSAVTAFFVIAATGVAVVFYFGMATSLELTPQYWACIGAAAIIGTAAMLLLRLVVPWFRDGIYFWVEPLGARPFPYTRLLTLVLGGFIGITGWIVFVAPALYSGDSGANTFRDQARDAGPATTQFVAAMTAPGTPLRRGWKDIAAGDYYALESGSPMSMKEPDRFLDYEKKEFLGAVSASGSPFPIYPGRVLEHITRGKAEFIDGGFAHLVPVEGAVLLGAKQVLIVANAAVRDTAPAAASDNRIVSLLLSDALRTFNLLFERSQMVDVRLERDVLVATIAPTWKGPDPFLMDFRPKQISDLVEAANNDALHGRPGRVLSWGEPEAYGVDEQP